MNGKHIALGYDKNTFLENHLADTFILGRIAERNNYYINEICTENDCELKNVNLHKDHNSLEKDYSPKIIFDDKFTFISNPDYDVLIRQFIQNSFLTFCRNQRDDESEGSKFDAHKLIQHIEYVGGFLTNYNKGSSEEVFKYSEGKEAVYRIQVDKIRQSLDFTFSESETKGQDYKKIKINFSFDTYFIDQVAIDYLAVGGMRLNGRVYVNPLVKTSLLTKGNLMIAKSLSLKEKFFPDKTRETLGETLFRLLQTEE